MSYQVVNDEIRKSILILLRPLVQINFILGTCPCIISPEGQIKTPFKYFNFIRFFLIVGLLIFLSLSPVLRGCISMYSPSPDDEYLNKNYFQGTKNGNTEVLGMTLTRYVDMACGFYANLIPAVFLCLASCKRKQILNFFDSMSSYVTGISVFSDYSHVKRITTRLFIMHGVFGLVSSVMLASRFVENSAHGPGTLAIWFLQKDNTIASSQWLIWSMAPFFGFLSVAKTAVTAFIEVCCVSLACCFCKVIENIQDYLNDVMRHWSRRFLDDPLSGSIFNQRHCDPETDRTTTQDGCKAHKIEHDFKQYLEQIRGNAQYASGKGGNDGIIGRVHGDFCDFQDLTPGQQIIFVIDKFQSVRNMQTVANGLFGFVLALDTSLTVFMSVVLKYMLIWNFGNLIHQQVQLKNLNATFSGEKLHEMMNETTINITRSEESYWVTSSSSEWTLFALLDACFTIRLFVLLICLGNVHYTSVNFNSRLSQALLLAQKITDCIDLKGPGSNKYFHGRPVMTSNEANTVLAFITENSANPMAFSAAGLFCFSRNLILVIISIITTYLVFLMQIKN